MSDTVQLPLADRDRAIKTSTAALVVNAEGQEVLVGLDRAQSEWLLESLLLEPEEMTPGDRRRYLKLHELHELARAAALASKRSS